MRASATLQLSGTVSSSLFSFLCPHSRQHVCAMMPANIASVHCLLKLSNAIERSSVV